MDVVNEINAAHAKEDGAVTKDGALDCSDEQRAAAAAIRALSDEELDRAATIAQRGRAANVPVRARGSRGAPFLSPPRASASNVEEVRANIEGVAPAEYLLQNLLQALGRPRQDRPPALLDNRPLNQIRMLHHQVDDLGV